MVKAIYGMDMCAINGVFHFQCNKYRSEYPKNNTAMQQTEYAAAISPLRLKIQNLIKQYVNMIPCNQYSGHSVASVLKMTFSYQLYHNRVTTQT